jgi:hypothetical protein
MKGHLRIINLSSGKVEFEKDNLIVDKAVELMIDRLKDNTKSFLDYVAIGTGTTAPATSDTALETEVFRKQATGKDATTTQLKVRVQVTDSEAVFTWKEIGVFNDASAGEMFNRIAVDYTKSALDAVEVEFVFTFERGV